MRPKMGKKVTRNFYIAEWANEWIEANRNNFAGPGNLISTAIMAFKELPLDKQDEYYGRFLMTQTRKQRKSDADKDVSAMVENVVQAEPAAEKQRKQKHSNPKSA